jgi:zinc transport system substrate-binding protein
VLATAASQAACGPPSRVDDGRLFIVASFYPLQFVAGRVGGDRVTVANLVKAGAEPHDLELSPWQMVDIADADLVLYLRGFQPAVDAAVGEAHAFDVSHAVTPLTPNDPHIWLDPSRLAAVANAVGDQLSAIDPAHADGYRTRSEALQAQLHALDTEFRAGLKACVRDAIVTSHAAFGYLADRYGLRQVAITGVTPEDEPTPKRLAAAVEVAKRTKATTIFFETLVSAKVARAVADEVGARAEVLDPIEGVEAGSGDDYFSLMRADLATLRTALGCR